MIRPTPEFDDAGGVHQEHRPSISQEELLRETAREIVRLSPTLAAILCHQGAKKIASTKPGGVLTKS